MGVMPKMGKTEVGGPSKPKPYYPSISLTSDNVDGLGDCKLGDEYDLHFRGKVKELREGKDYSSEEGHRAEFQLTHGVVLAAGKKKHGEAKDYEDGREHYYKDLGS
jgi:hypothetical protein